MVDKCVYFGWKTDMHNLWRKCWTCEPSEQPHGTTWENTSETTLSGAEGAGINVQECESCKETFYNASDFIFHVENNHKEAAVIFHD